MIPPKAKSIISQEVNKYVQTLKTFKNSNPVIILGQIKLDRIDHKLMKQSQKLNQRELNQNVKIQQGNKKYQKRKAAITYRSYTIQFKKKLIQKIKQLNQKSKIGLSKIIRAKGRQLRIHPKNIFRWFHTKQIKKKQGGRKALFPQMQQRLAQFIINNPKMKRKHILRQAKQIMQDLQIPGRQYFNFSKGWYERFRQRLIRKKIIPGNFFKSQFPHNLDSNSDQSQYSIMKKEQCLLKDQYVIKEEYQQAKYFIKQEFKDKYTKNILNNNYIIFYDQFIKNYKNEEIDYKKVKKQQKKESIKVTKQIRQIEQEIKTNASGQKNYKKSSFDFSNPQQQLSIFASDDQN